MITDIETGGNHAKLAGRVYWPLFGCTVRVAMGVDGEVSVGYAEKCVSQLLALDAAGTAQLLQASISFFRDVERCHGEPVPMEFEFEGMDYPSGLDRPENILPYIKPVELYIDREIAGCYSVSLFAECAWEPEHGLQWVVRNGKPLYAGGAGGLGSHCEEAIYLENWKDSNYLVNRFGR